MTHSAILAFRQTEKKEFPLILVVGREPNNDSVSDKKVGTYDFTEFPKCAFWNIAFKLMGTYNGFTTAQMKELFLQKNASPIIFTDASPKAILNKVKDKNAIRLTLTDEEIIEHVDSIFANEVLLKRVKMVLFSGIEDTKYNKFKTLFNQQALQRQIPTKDIAFLMGNNYPKIEKQIGDKEIVLFKQVFNSFK